MFMEERHQAILEVIAQNGRITIGEIQEKFEVSLDSARRDLRILEEKQLLKRTHGGAISLRQADSRPPRVRDFSKMEVVYPHYDAIARRAAQEIRENDVAYLTSGSIGFLMLAHLPRDFHYTLVVNSVALANELKYWDNVEVYIVGGKMRMHGTASLVDGFAQDFIAGMQMDLCLMTGAGVDAAFGFSNCTAETAAFQRAVVAHSRRKLLLLPNEKVGFRAVLKVCDANAFDTLITDDQATEDELLRLEEQGLEIIVVETKE